MSQHLPGWYQRRSLIHFVDHDKQWSLCGKFEMRWIDQKHPSQHVVWQCTLEQAKFDCCYPRHKSICLFCAKKILPETRVKGARK